LLQIVLSGQPELTRVLSHPNLWQLKQRIAVRLHIDPLSLDDVKAFIQHRWTRAGGAVPHPFTEEAISLIALWSQGIPRLVNSLCDNGLLQACSQQGKKVGADEVLQVIVDLDLPVPLRRIRVADSEKTRTALAWSRQAALEFNGLPDQHMLTGELEEPKTEAAPGTLESLEQPAEADNKLEAEGAAEVEVEEPIASAARGGLEAISISDVQMAVGPKWNGRPSNGNPVGHSHDRVRIRRVTRFEPETKETSLINRLFARLGIQGQKLA
jgi:hypothetical protein